MQNLSRATINDPLPSTPVISHEHDGFDRVEGDLGQLCLVDQLRDRDGVVDQGEG